MKRFISIISVILCVLTAFSSANILSFAADENSEFENVETVEAADMSEEKEYDDESESDDCYTPSENITAKKLYKECVEDKFLTGISLMLSPGLFPMIDTAASTAVIVPLLFLPVTVPLSFAAGVAVVPAGVVLALISPITGLIEYLKQSIF